MDERPRKLSLLAEIRVASPCPIPEETPRQGSKSACIRCEKQVYDLATLTSSELETLLETHATAGTLHEVCMRFRSDANGAPKTTALLRPRRAPLWQRAPLAALIASCMLLAVPEEAFVATENFLEALTDSALHAGKNLCAAPALLTLEARHPELPNNTERARERERLEKWGADGKGQTVGVLVVRRPKRTALCPPGDPLCE